MAIYLTGDTHVPYDVEKLKKFKGQEGDTLIILGDFGLYWQDNDVHRKWKKYFNSRKYKVMWLDGNHENFDWIAKLPVGTWSNSMVHYEGNIIHLMRGEVYEIEGRSFFVCGGGISVDKHLRTEGVSWWSQEDISWEEANNAMTNLTMRGNEVDYILTHTIFPEVIKDMFGLEPWHNEGNIGKLLKLVYDSVKFKEWYFGHYHEDVDNGRLHCLYNRIVKL